jgi:DMSO/TMAO reductase YedYZ heme-binding membrane subunit
MITLPLAFILFILSKYASKQIRKHSVSLYIFSTIIAIIAFVLIKVPIFKPITQGYLGLAFYYLVMIAGALPKGKMRSSLFSIRKEYSILGFIFILPHGLYYFIQYLNHSISIPLFGILSLVIMIPLFITSFHVIRKKFTYTGWKRLQSLAYVVYLFLFIHMINVKDTIEQINFILYVILFSVYFVLKLRYEIKRRQEK